MSKVTPSSVTACPMLLHVRDLSIDATANAAGGPRCLVDQVSFGIAPGEMVALVGESGSGKTLIARALLGLLPPGLQITRGSLIFEGTDLLGLSPDLLRRVRGARIGMIFQEPMVSLNPAMRIGEQMAEAMRLHTPCSKAEIRRRSLTMLERVRIADPERCLRRYPYEFSGGMRQRILLASVLMLKPALLLADEPTTALDKLVQKEVLDLMRELALAQGTAVLLITHDLPLVAKYAHRVVVVECGRLREQGAVAAVLARPQHPYTRRLLSALHLPRDQHTPEIAAAEPLLEVENLRVQYARRSWWKPDVREILHGLSFSIARGEIVALVGESGSGKTTLARTILGLLPAVGGSVRFAGVALSTARAGTRIGSLSDEMQMVFQDPASSFDPRLRIGQIVAEGLGPRCGLNRAARGERVGSILHDVELGTDFLDRFPHELSGGQRQRVAIARALIRRPKLLVADEPVSALDLTVQAQILALLHQLRCRYGFACLFISHDLLVVRSLADRVLIMHQGAIVESGLVENVFDRPQSTYARALLHAAPQLVRSAAGGLQLRERGIVAPGSAASRIDAHPSRE